MSRRSRGPRVRVAKDMGRRARARFPDTFGERPRNPFIGVDRQLARSWAYGFGAGIEGGVFDR